MRGGEGEGEGRERGEGEVEGGYCHWVGTEVGRR